MRYFVYILASRPGGAIYIGSTSDLRGRVEQHRARAVPGYTADYGVTTLVWFQEFESYGAARLQERRMKRWRRAWKDALIMKNNPGWRDITADIPL